MTLPPAIYIPGEVDAETFSKSPLLVRQYEAQMAQATEPIKKILFSADTISQLIVIGVDFDLTEQQSAEVSRVVRDIVLGNSYLGDMVTILQDKLTVDEPKARAIANTIVSTLLRPAMEDIKALQAARFTNKIRQSERSAAPSNVVDLRQKP